MPDKRLPIDLLIFDFDGTLTDSIPPAIEAIQAMLAELKLPHKTAAEIHQYVGYGEIPLVSGAIGSSEPVLLQKARELYFRNYVENGLNRVPLYPHVQEVLEYFGPKLKVIVSNKKDDFINIVLKNLGLTSTFKHVYGGDTAPCLKPDPCTIIKVLKDYKIEPERALFIGDMTVDIETGRNAGIHTCAVTYGFDPKEKLAEARPDLIIDDFLKLKDLIV